MIQRVQTIYLIFSILICALMVFVPLGTLNADGSIYSYFYHAFESQGMQEEMDRNIILSLSLYAIMILQLVAVFMFGNRRLQSILVQLSFILQLSFFVLAMMILEVTPPAFISEMKEVTLNLGYGIMLMVIPMICSLMALRGIKKDEALVRSADRMR